MTNHIAKAYHVIDSVEAKEVDMETKHRQVKEAIRICQPQHVMNRDRGGGRGGGGGGVQSKIHLQALVHQ